MKRLVAEDNIICQTQTRGEKAVIRFWELLYPQHPIVRLRTIIDSHEDDLFSALSVVDHTWQGTVAVPFDVKELK